MVVTGTGAPCPSGLWGGCEHAGLLLSAAGTRSCSAMGRHGVLCVIRWDLCLSAFAREELRDNAFNAAPFVLREDVLLRAVLGCSFFSSSWRGKLGQGHVCKVEAGGRGSGPLHEPGLGLALICNKCVGWFIEDIG